MIEKRRVLVEKYCDSFLVQTLTLTHKNSNWWYNSRLGEKFTVEVCTKDSYELFKIFLDNDELLTYNYWDYYLNKDDGACSIMLKRDCKRIKK